MKIDDIDYLSIKQNNIQGRYITYNHISKILVDFPSNFKVEKIGNSVHGSPIESITLGQGSKKIFMWSQMHGNESTTTKAVFDLINLLGTDSKLTEGILGSCTIKVIPMLNPDGAKAYTRVNANDVDLNRDAQNRSQPESEVLRECYDTFKPDFCFNLHDQRTIFNVGATPKPATVSFLAPAQDENRSISNTRAISMQLIAAMSKQLNTLIPGQIGRYDDTFNANCVGDTFQMLHTPTVLFEAGHFPGDYEREITRRCILNALVTALKVISDGSISDYKKEDYFDIPENKKCFYDVLIKNVHILNSNKYGEGDAIGILFKEVLGTDAIEFVPVIEKTGNLKGYFGHKTYDCLISNDLVDLKAQSFWSDL
jgi:zinc carboxypeptidase